MCVCFLASIRRSSTQTLHTQPCATHALTSCLYGWPALVLCCPSQCHQSECPESMVYVRALCRSTLVFFLEYLCKINSAVVTHINYYPHAEGSQCTKLLPAAVVTAVLTYICVSRLSMNGRSRICVSGALHFLQPFAGFRSPRPIQRPGVIWYLWRVAARDGAWSPSMSSCTTAQRLHTGITTHPPKRRDA